MTLLANIRIATPLFLFAFLAGPTNAAERSIAEIQGADHKSPITAEEVTTSGIVTGHFGSGFFFQSASPDGDQATSEGIFVFLGSSPDFPLPARGEIVTVTGQVTEFQPLLQPPLFPTREQAVCGTTQIATVNNQDRGTFLAGTQIYRISALTVDGSGDLPEPVPFAPPGMNTTIGYADKPHTPFNPTNHPRDYFESLEGMRVVIEDAVIMSRKDRGWDQFWVAPATGLDADDLTAYGLPVAHAGHVFPEVVQVHKAVGQPAFALPVGTKLGDLTGILTYENGNYMVVLDAVIDETAYPPPTQPAVVPPTIPQGLRIATYNAENLTIGAPGSANRFAAIAAQVVGDLNSPDIIALQEVQDDDGQGATAVVTATQTIGALVDAILVAGGRRYLPVALDPIQPNTDGGAPGANIRTVFLVPEDRGVKILSSERLFDGDDRCDSSANPFQASRRPLLVEAEIDGTRYVLVNLHLSSKLGDQGLYTNAEDPQPGSTDRRRRQAAQLVAELERRYSDNPPVILLMGDFNDHVDAKALEPCHQSTLGFTFHRDHRGDTYTASYAFNGVREAIDLFLVGGAGLPNATVTYLNLNADSLTQVSDHNPVVLVAH